MPPWLVSGFRSAGLQKAYTELSLWREPIMKVESPDILVYRLTKDMAIQSRQSAGDIVTQIDIINSTVNVRDGIDTNSIVMVGSDKLYF